MKRWYSKSSSVDELEISIKSVQDSMVSLQVDGEIKYILEKSNGQFLIVWVEQKAIDKTVSVKTSSLDIKTSEPRPFTNCIN